MFVEVKSFQDLEDYTKKHAIVVFDAPKRSAFSAKNKAFWKKVPSMEVPIVWVDLDVISINALKEKYNIDIKDIPTTYVYENGKVVKIIIGNDASI